MQELVYALNKAGAELARRACDRAEAEDGRRRFVAGALGPTNRTASISPDVNNPGYRAVTFDDLRLAYGEQIRGLIDGGADLLLIETIFDTLNAKAGDLRRRGGLRREGRRPADHDLGHDHRPLRPHPLGPDADRLLALGAPRPALHHRPQLRARRRRHARAPRRALATSPTPSSAPTRTPACRTSSAATTRRPEFMARQIEEFAREGLVNIVGGCCGTTPDHIRAIAEAVAKYPPRAVPEKAPLMRLSGLEPFTLTPEIPFVNVGERTNVTGSARFRKLITAGDYAAALEVARDQVENGAQVIDVNMDEGLIDSEAAMAEFLNLLAAEPDIARVPLMIDCSKWEVIEAGLKCVQGKPHRQLDLDEGGRGGLPRPRPARAGCYGAAVVVMAFDEQGQADTEERKVEICTRAYRILTEEVGFPPEDIVFDPNIFAVATGIEEHDNYGVDFIEATRRINATLPHVHISGGVSQPLLLVPRQRAGARGDARGLPLPRHPGGHGHGHRQRRPARRLRLDRARAARGLRGRDPQPPPKGEGTATERLLEIAERFKGAAGKEAKERDLAWRDVAGREAARARPRQRHHRVHRGRHRGGAARRRAPAPRHRGPADGGHERRRRPLRLGQDVPAAGGEVRPGDEAGRRRAPALHGGREARQRRRRRAPESPARS